MGQFEYLNDLIFQGMYYLNIAIIKITESWNIKV